MNGLLRARGQRFRDKAPDDVSLGAPFFSGDSSDFRALAGVESEREVIARSHVGDGSTSCSVVLDPNLLCATVEHMRTHANTARDLLLAEMLTNPSMRIESIEELVPVALDDDHPDFSHLEPRPVEQIIRIVTTLVSVTGKVLAGVALTGMTLR